MTGRLGEGTFAVVYAGRKAGLDRDVAIKVLKAQAGADVRAGMASELDATVRLTTHPNIVDVLDAGTTSAGDPYMVMGLERQTLADRLVDYACVPWLEAVGIGVKISGALQTAHSAGLLHRDIKPQNILLSEYGEPKLADFGVAQALAVAGGPPQGHVFTPYSAPEVLSERRHSEVSDVYSLAATIHALIAGTPPFGYGGSEGGDLALAAAISNDPVPDLSQKPFSVPEPVADVLREAMDRDPAQRPQTALELGTELVAAARQCGEKIPDPVVVREVVQPADGVPPTRRVVERMGRLSPRRRKGGMLRRLFIRARWWTVRHHRGLLVVIAGLAAAGVLGGVFIHLAREGPPRWIPRAPMPTARSWLGTAIGGDRRIYAVGGLGSDGRALATVEAYDPRSNRWTPERDLQAARWGAAVTTAGDGRLYAIGGIANDQVLDSVEVARPGGAWTSVRRLPSPRWAAAAVGDRDGRIYVFGGFATKDSHHAVAAIDVYTPGTNTWSRAGLMPLPRGAMATVATPNGEIYALGGTDGPEFTNVDIYDPTTDSWRTGPRLPRARSGLGAGIDADGRVYAVGGYADRHAVAEVDVLESGGRAWAASTPLPLPLYAPVATTPDGRIFVVGGATDTRGLQRMWELVSATAP